MPVVVPLPSHFDIQNFTIVALDSSDSAERNSISGRKYVHDPVATDFQVIPSTIKSKSTMSSADASAIKNLGKLKWQEIVSFHYNQQLLLESTLLVGQELYTNSQMLIICNRIYTELPPKRFIMLI